ncbi:Major facilitator superfamily domain-containing protein 12 [Exaiptasia diaphana]|nr:Major facilitator superfamily domain-containing protein 12 [Exaiptasia diaphana]
MVNSPTTQVALLYMSTRLVVNLSQVYLPMYVTETLMLSKETIAIMPLIVYISGFVSTFFAKPLNQYMGRKVTFSIGCIIMICACTSFRFISIHGDNYKQQFMYGGSVALGIGGSVMLITALAIISEMIGKNKETGAFVYGAMSFVDKLSNGIAVQIIQIFHPCSHAEFCCGKCAPFYRDVMTYVAGGAAILALIALLTLWKTKIGRFDKECSGQKKLMGCNQTNSSSISRSEPENGSIRNGPAIPYYPTKQSNYGSIECQNKVNGSIQQAPNACQLKKCSNVNVKNTGTVDT